jgi:hypothetical protein
MSLMDTPPPGLSDGELSALKSDLAGLYRRVAETLEQSAQLADRHAQRCRTAGRMQLVDIELENARRARAAALRGRAAAERLTDTD